MKISKVDIYLFRINIERWVKDLVDRSWSKRSLDFNNEWCVREYWYWQNTKIDSCQTIKSERKTKEEWELKLCKQISNLIIILIWKTLLERDVWVNALIDTTQIDMISEIISVNKDKEQHTSCHDEQEWKNEICRMIDVDEWNERFDIIRTNVLSMNEAKITQRWM